MKSKFYWEQQRETSRPFDLPRRITEGINACRKNLDGERAPASVRYIWIYLTDQGLRHGHYETGCDCQLSLDDWLNIIDESAALGAEWVMMYVGASLSQSPHVWQMCDWAQQTHGLNVGLHITCNCLSEDDIEHLTQLEAERTYLVCDSSTGQSLRPLKERGLHVCESDLHLREKMSRCTKPTDMACIGPDGRMFSCGLVLGDQEFSLGDAREQRLDAVMSDNSLPHTIEDMTRHPESGCCGCPSLVEQHLHGKH